MGKIYCTECGAELNESSAFCSKCGNPIDSDEKSNAKSNSINTNDLTNNIQNTILNKPIIIILGVVILLLIVGIFALMGSSGGDLVDVIDVIYETKIDYGDTPFGGISSSPTAGSYYSAVAFKIIPKETITGINAVRLENFKITYENGETEDLGTITFNNKNTYLQGKQYTFTYHYNLDEDVYGQNVHIKGDIVVDTLDQKNKVIGHLDYDTTAKAYSANY